MAQSKPGWPELKKDTYTLLSIFLCSKYYLNKDGLKGCGTYTVTKKKLRRTDGSITDSSTRACKKEKLRSKAHGAFVSSRVFSVLSNVQHGYRFVLQVEEQIETPPSFLTACLLPRALGWVGGAGKKRGWVGLSPGSIPSTTSFLIFLFVSVEAQGVHSRSLQ